MLHGAHIDGHPKYFIGSAAATFFSGQLRHCWSRISFVTFPPGYAQYPYPAFPGCPMLLPHKLLVLTPLVQMQQLLPILPQFGLFATHVPVCQSGSKALSPGDVYWQKVFGAEQMFVIEGDGSAGFTPLWYRLGQQGLPGAEPQSFETGRHVPSKGPAGEAKAGADHPLASGVGVKKQ